MPTCLQLEAKGRKLEDRVRLLEGTVEKLLGRIVDLEGELANGREGRAVVESAGGTRQAEECGVVAGKVGELEKGLTTVQIQVEEMRDKWAVPAVDQEAPFVEVVNKRNVKRAEGRKVGKRAAGKLVLVGDSLARGVGDRLVEQCGDRASKLSVGGARIEGVAEMIKGVEDSVDSHVVIIAGTNNLRKDGDKLIYRKYDDLLKVCKSRQGSVSVVGILRRRDCGRDNGYVDSKRMGINRRLEKMCVEAGVHFVDVEVSRWHLAEDGLHLNWLGQEFVGKSVFDADKHLN